MVNSWVSISQLKNQNEQVQEATDLRFLRRSLCSWQIVGSRPSEQVNSGNNFRTKYWSKIPNSCIVSSMFNYNHSRVIQISDFHRFMMAVFHFYTIFTKIVRSECNQILKSTSDYSKLYSSSLLVLETPSLTRL